jgi:glycosyltransferase involved in cell wall biosynthesis
MKISYITITRFEPSRLEFIRQAQQSLEQQIEKDIEWVIVTDNPDYKLFDSSLQYKIILDTRANRPSKAWNIGIKKAEGDYIAFLDDDDLKMHQFGYTMLREIGDNDALFCRSEVMDINNKKIGAHWLATVNFNDAWNYQVFILMGEVLIKKSFIEGLGGFDEEMSTCEDYDMAFRIFKEGKVKMISDPLSRIRKHKDNYGGRRDEGHIIKIQRDMLHILKKFDRADRNCPHCGMELSPNPYPESMVKWLNGWRRFCPSCWGFYP